MRTETFFTELGQAFIGHPLWSASLMVCTLVLASVVEVMVWAVLQ